MFAKSLCQRIGRVHKDSPPSLEEGYATTQSAWSPAQSAWFDMLHKLGLDQFRVDYTLPPSAELLRGSTQV